MDEMALVTEIIFANLLDIIPLISTETEIHPAIMRIYERNAAFFLDMNPDLIQHQEERNFTE